MKKPMKKQVISAAIDVVFATVFCFAAVIAGLRGWRPHSFYFYLMDLLSTVELGFFFIFLLVEIISVITISDSTWHTIFIAATLLGYHFTTVDFTRVLLNNAPSATGIVSLLFGDLNFLFFELEELAFFCFWNYTHKLGMTKREAAVFGGWALVCLGAYIPLDLIGLGVVAVSVFCLPMAFVGVRIFGRVFRGPSPNGTFFITKGMFFTMMGSVFTANLCEACNFAANGFAALQSLPIIFVFLSVYAAFAMRTDRAALKASEYKLQYERIKARALREQIKPHFVFNVLAAIQSLYRISLDEGDRATALLSMHLRTNIEASDTDLIPFERELDNIQVYIDLENMRLSEKINVIFDIDCTDFEVPVLSLQPYIENAIKYSRINEKPDGSIRITSRRTDRGILLEVADNGVGFDTKTIPPSSCGIRNSSERFSMLLGVQPEIVSERGKGTAVRIMLKPSKHRGGAEESFTSPERSEA